MPNRRFSLRVPVTVALAALAIAAAGFLYSYLRYRWQLKATYEGIHNTSWGKGARLPEIEYEKCFWPRFKDVSFFGADSIMCGGYYLRQPAGIELYLFAYIREVDYYGIRIKASSGGAVDLQFRGSRGVVHAYRRGFAFNIDCLIQQDSIPVSLDTQGPLQVAFIKRGGEADEYADLYFGYDYRSEYTPEQAKEWLRKSLGNLKPLRPVSRQWPDGPAGDGATGSRPGEGADAPPAVSQPAPSSP